MELIGMLDSPYVRRVAITMQYLDVPFEHKALSVFRDYAEFENINPLVKAPTLVCDDGEVLMDSTLIIQFAESLTEKSLLAGENSKLQKILRMIGLALNVCDKSVQYYYEISQRPEDLRHQPWMDRVTRQLGHACNALETEFKPEHAMMANDSPNQAGISAAVAFKFAQQILPANILDMDKFTSLSKFSAQMEKRVEFKRAAFGDKAYPVD